MPVAGLRCTLVVLLTSMTVPASAQSRRPACAIDMGSNSFRRIVGSFADGRYVETRIEARTMGVGDDVERNGRDPYGVQGGLRERGSAQARCHWHGGVQGRAERLGGGGSRGQGRRQDGDRDRGARVGACVSRRSLGNDLRHHAFNLGYRIAYDQFFAKATDPAAAIAAFRERLLEHAAKAPFMKGRQTLVGVEFGEMAEILLPRAPTEGRVLTLQVLQQRLREIASQPGDFERLKKTEDIDRALPRLVAAAVFAEAFGYSQIELTGRQLGTGLIIEAGLARR